MKYEYYHRVPKNPYSNMAFRQWILAESYKSREFWLSVHRACQRDILFWMNTFGWLQEPRNVPGQAPVAIPMLTRCYQDDAIKEMIRAIEEQVDCTVDKSRATGATWMALFVTEWYLLFHDSCMMGLVSRTEDAVDKPDDPDALMQKMDFIHSTKHYPGSFLPSLDRHKLRLKNNSNGSTVIGYAAVSDVGRGGRKLFMVKDEFGFFAAERPNADYDSLKSTQHVTNTRFFISTPSGPSGAHYDVVHEKDSNAVRIVLDWKDDYDKARGLYTTRNGALLRLDESYQYPPGYKFVLDGRLRSHYYDDECKRPGATKQSIAQELDRDFGGAGSNVFDPDFIRECMVECREPIYRGAFQYDPETLEGEFKQTGDGKLEVWCGLDDRLRPADDFYYAGADVAAGTGGDHSSNSALVIFNSVGEQVLQFVTRHMPPAQFCRMCIAICKWFRGKQRTAVLNWDANGPTGALFTTEWKRWQYHPVYYRDVNMEGASSKKTRKPGFQTTAKTKGALLGTFSSAMEQFRVRVRSQVLMDECFQFEYINGLPVHKGSRTTSDHAAKGEAHGDVVIGACMAVVAMEDDAKIESPKATEADQAMNPPPGSMAHRLAEYDREREMESEEW